METAHKPSRLSCPTRELKTILSVKVENTSDVFETNDDEPNVYKENFWPAKPEEPKGFTYKGKSKMMTYIVFLTQRKLEGQPK